MSTTEELKLLKEVAESTGIILDPVYSGKALNGMLKDMAENPSRWEGRKVLFVHTGDLLGMYDKVQQLQPLTGKCERLRIAETVLKAGDGKGQRFELTEWSRNLPLWGMLKSIYQILHAAQMIPEVVGLDSIKVERSS